MLKAEKLKELEAEIAADKSLPLQESITLEAPYSTVDAQLSHGAGKVETIAGGATIERSAAFA